MKTTAHANGEQRSAKSGEWRAALRMRSAKEEEPLATYYVLPISYSHYCLLPTAYFLIPFSTRECVMQ